MNVRHFPHLYGVVLQKDTVNNMGETCEQWGSFNGNGNKKNIYNNHLKEIGNVWA